MRYFSIKNIISVLDIMLTSVIILLSKILFLGSSMAEHLAVNERVAGSSPAQGANHF